MSEKLFITRKRKKYKFAKFNEFDNCFQLDEWKTARGSDPRVNRGGVVVEIGAGTGLFSVELAQRHPENFYIAVDIKSDRLYTGAKLANELGLQNIVFVRSEISELTEIVSENSVDEIWITFPDPFATEDQTSLTSTGNRKRLTAPRFLEMYKQVLFGNGKLNFKTDNQPLFNWSVEQLKENGWKVNKQIRDLHKSNSDNDEKIMTTYEKRFVAEGLAIYYLSAQAS